MRVAHHSFFVLKEYFRQKMLVLDIVVLQWASPGEYSQILVEHYSLDYLVRGGENTCIRF